MAKVITIHSIKTNYILNALRMILQFVTPLIIFPYISRILGPQYIGKVDFTNSIISYFILFSALGIPTYGVREIARVRDDIRSRSKTVWELTIILSIMVPVGYIFYFILLNTVDAFYSDFLLFCVVSPSLFFSTFCYDWFYVGIEDQVYITVRFIVIKLLQIICVFLFVKTIDDYLIYAVVIVGLGGLSSVFNIIHLKKYVIYIPFRELNVFRHIKPVLIVFTSIVATSIYMQLDITMVGLFAGEVSVGLYTAANKLIRVLIAVVTALSAVVVPRIENALKANDIPTCKRYLNLSLHYILILALPFMFGIIALARDVIIIFAGNQYLEAVTSIRILSPIIVIVGLAYFVGLQILYPLRQEWKYSVSVSIAAVVNFVLNAALIPRFKQNGAVVGTLTAELIGLVLQIIFARQYILKTDLISLNTLKYILASLVMYITILFLPPFNNVLLHLIICFTVSIFVYAGMLLLLREQLIFEIFRRVVK